MDNPTLSPDARYDVGHDVSERMATVPTSLTGIWGEAAAVLALRAAGCSVQWDGGMTAGRDLRATTATGRSLHAQVKTSTVVDGRIAWKKWGQPALDWGDSVEAEGFIPLYVFVHFPSLATASVDLTARTLTVQMPEDYRVTAASPARFAADVDAERTAYGQRIRQRDDRYGRAGDPLPPHGLQYPVTADQYDDLREVLQDLP